MPQIARQMVLLSSILNLESHMCWPSATRILVLSDRGRCGQSSTPRPLSVCNLQSSI
jgi:hypothetical protein